MQFYQIELCFFSIKTYSCNLSYYFDDGKVASEKIKEATAVQDDDKIKYTLSGSGYFRFVYKQKFYNLNYNITNVGLEGVLGK